MGRGMPRPYNTFVSVGPFCSFPLQLQKTGGRIDLRPPVWDFAVSCACCNFVFLEFAGEMEADMLEVLLRHLKHIARVSEEDIAAFAVLRHVLVFTLLEVLEFFGRIALNPASL